MGTRSGESIRQRQRRRAQTLVEYALLAALLALVAVGVINYAGRALHQLYASERNAYEGSTRSEAYPVRD